MGNQPSFISEARKEQIIQAAIQTLHEFGYVHVSLAKIAKNAEVSTGLISYHFADKEDLLNNTLIYLVEHQVQYIQERIAEKESPHAQLIAFIEASLGYQREYREYNIAMIEIVFHARTAENVPYYQLANHDDDPIYLLLQHILYQGQQSQGFASFHVQHISTMIQGAIAESMLIHEDTFDYDGYQQELVQMVTKMVT